MTTDELTLIILQKKELAQKHYENFEKYYHEKNYSKSSEFLWGTLNAIIYSLGQIANKKLGTYTEQKNFLGELATITNDDEMKDQYRAAKAIHSNFFHNHMSEDDFEYDKDKVIKLIEKLYDILEEKMTGDIEPTNLSA